MEIKNQNELIVNKSAFMGYAFSIDNENDFKATLLKLKQEHKNAKHICYAYSFCENGILKEKCFDDGEPKGTAGKPILDVIKKKELKNICVFVVRYFGGILLGAGGLTRAYRKCTAELLNNNK